MAQAEAQWGRMPQRDPLGAVWQRLRLLIHLCWPRDRSRPPPECSPLQGKACGAWLEEEGGSEGLVVPSSSQADGIRRGGAQPGTLRARVPRGLAGGPVSLGAAAHRPASGPAPFRPCSTATAALAHAAREQWAGSILPLPPASLVAARVWSGYTRLSRAPRPFQWWQWAPAEVESHMRKLHDIANNMSSDGVRPAPSSVPPPERVPRFAPPHALFPLPVRPPCSCVTRPLAPSPQGGRGLQRGLHANLLREDRARPRPALRRRRRA